jgi:hypothetical protein
MMILKATSVLERHNRNMCMISRRDLIGLLHPHNNDTTVTHMRWAP